MHEYDQAESLRQLVQSVKAPFSGVQCAPVVAIASGKGGVGKTCLTVNLAIALSQLGHKVLVMDADADGAGMDVFVGGSAPVYHLSSILEQAERLQAVADDGCNLKYISCGLAMQRLAKSQNKIQIADKISKLSILDDWADLILVDTGSGVGNYVLNFALAADQVILVTAPEPPALTGTYAMLKAYAAVQGKAQLRLLVNGAAASSEGRTAAGKLVQAAERFLAVTLSDLGVVCQDEHLITAVKRQKPLMLVFPDAPAAIGIRAAARRLIADQQLTGYGLQAFLTNVLQPIHNIGGG